MAIGNTVYLMKEIYQVGCKITHANIVIRDMKILLLKYIARKMFK